jgi:hypothetical protein
VAPESAPAAARGEHTSAGRIGRRSSPGKGSKEATADAVCAPQAPRGSRRLPGAGRRRWE